jgi:pimeloyl-ACP methyl ester carboxylesterase
MAATSLPQEHQADAADTSAKRRAAMAQLRRADPELFVRAVAMQLYPSGIDEATFRAFVHHFRTAATPEMQDRLDTVMFDVAHLIPALKIPTLVLHRRGDQTAPFASGQELAQRISGARFIPLEGDAHFEWAGDTQSVVRPMLDFLLDRT